MKSRALAGIGVAATILSFFGVAPTALLLGIGLASGVYGWFRNEPSRRVKPLLGVLGAVGILIALPVVLTLVEPHAGSRATPAGIFDSFLKIGSVLYGSGYVLLAFLRAELVNRLHWLSLNQVLDATAVGQFTPGPVFTTATFIGYLVGGPCGAVAATLGIFLPAFLLVAISGSLISELRKSPTASCFLDGVNAASVALMAYVTLELAVAALVDVLTLVLAAVSAVLLFRFRINSAWLVLGGALAGLVGAHWR
jgi:chromate transporter